MTGTDIATRQGTALAANDDYYAALAVEAQGLKGGGDGKAFLKFDGNDGNYSYGADDTPLELSSLLVMNPRSYKRGYVIWVSQEVVYEEMRDLSEPKLEKHQLPDKGPYTEDDGPVEQYTVEFGTMDEPFVNMIFQANNTSKRRALAALLKDFGANYKLHPGALPVIEIDEKEFEGKTKGGRKVTKHAPAFKIVDWITEDQLNSMAEGSPEDYEQSAEGADATEIEAEVEEAPVVETPKVEAKKATTAPAKAAVAPKAEAKAAEAPAATGARKPRSRF